MTACKHLVSLVGPSWARLIMYTGMRIEAAEALRIGLVDRVLPDAGLWDATMEIARTISGNAPLAIQAAKITIAQVLKDESKRDMDAIKEIGTACMDSRRFPRRPPRVHGKAQAAVQGADKTLQRRQHRLRHIRSAVAAAELHRLDASA